MISLLPAIAFADESDSVPEETSVEETAVPEEEDKEEPADKVSDLKNPFVKGSSSRGSGGTGLGLAIANNNLAMLGFKLDIQKDNDKFIATVKLK